MTARTGLSNLILTLRGLSHAGTGDYTIGTAIYWDGDHLQEILDAHRIDVVRDQLVPVPEYRSAGSVSYYEYRSHFGNLEQTTGGTSIFIIEDSTGTDIGTANYSVDYTRGIVTFTADQAGTVYYLTGRSYDLKGAASEIWRQKAGNAAEGYDIKTDNTSLSRSQRMKHYFDMADYYQSSAPANVVQMGRSDTP